MANFYFFEGTPSRILDFCELVGEDIQLPEYMAQFAGLHRRQDDQVSHSDGGYYSTADVESNWSAELQTLEGHSGSVQSVVFSADGRLLASGSSDETVRL
jgi:WD40 repeat protein